MVSAGAAAPRLEGYLSTPAACASATAGTWYLAVANHPVPAAERMASTVKLWPNPAFERTHYGRAPPR